MTVAVVNPKGLPAMHSQPEKLLSNERQCVTVVSNEQMTYREYPFKLFEQLNHSEIAIRNDGWGFALYDKYEGVLLCSASLFSDRDTALAHVQRTIDCIVEKKPIPSFFPVSKNGMFDYISFLLAEDQQEYVTHFKQLTKHNRIKSRLKARQMQIAARRILDLMERNTEFCLDWNSKETAKELWDVLEVQSAAIDKIPRKAETFRDWFKLFDSYGAVVDFACSESADDEVLKLMERGIDLILLSIKICNRVAPETAIEIDGLVVFEQFKEWLCWIDGLALEGPYPDLIDIPDQADVSSQNTVFCHYELSRWADEFNDYTGGKYDQLKVRSIIETTIGNLVSPS